MIYFLIGFMGSGKTTVGRLLAKELGLSFSDSDEEIEKKTGMSVSEIFAVHGEDHFRKLEGEFIAELQDEDQVISCGGGLPCYNSLMETILEKGKVFYLKSSPETLFKRLENERSERPLLAAGDLKETITARLLSREPFYEMANYVIRTDNRSPEQICEAILSKNRIRE